MRVRLLFIMLLIVPGALLSTFAQDATEPPDFFATATALIAGATQTAEARTATVEAGQQADADNLTATQLVTDITATVEAQDDPDDADVDDPADDDLTATQMRLDMTETVAAFSTQATAIPDTDDFALTVTANVRNITQTVEAQTGATSVPLPTQPADSSIDDPFVLTATQYVAQVTQTAIASGDTGTQAEPVEDNAFMPITMIILGALALLIVLGIIGAFVSRNNASSKRG